ncbi:MAG: Ni-sirohydrochlorin a,c-diamide reductive cyclase catalytic subunit [Methanobacteriaceae archaeon]|nr:Ni-sirohydrochlorin a,c-diamide reductive cyclase catalytic subunit [Methanobacteriaceae archaeon]
MLNHPRPSPIAAALYTLRDLEVQVVIMHGPQGCCFRTGRLLEDEGVRVLTTSMTEQDFIFGAKEKLTQTIQEAQEKFNPDKIGIVGTCASMIIGEDMHEAANDAQVKAKIIVVESHGGFGEGDNTAGAIATLNSAEKVGIISSKEVQRQSEMLKMATQIEKERGMAQGDYIQPNYGDNKVEIANKILNALQNNKKVTFVLNAKKETSYLFADILTIPWTKIYPDNHPQFICNIDENIGLPYIKQHAIQVQKEIDKKPDYITGGLDEYPLTGKKVREILLKDTPDLVIILGVPHAVDIKNLTCETIAVTDGPRLVKPLYDQGFTNVITELDAHSKTLGAKKIVESEFASTIRGLLK